MIFPEIFEKSRANWLNEYFKFNLGKFEQELSQKNEAFWIHAGERRALKIFHAAAERVPAYKNFLQKNNVRHGKIKTILDFRAVPLTDKKNYVSAYPLKDRAWGGKIESSKLTASSSGTTGSPNYWPRSGEQEFEAALTHELLYKNFFNIHKQKTLVIIGFPMGVYVSGMATVLPSYLVAQKYRMTVISAGNNKAEVLKAVKNLHQLYDQIILVGHPFFIKDTVETGNAEGIPWKKIHLNLMFCSEGFSEPWREYLMKEAGIKNKIGQTLSTYGSSELLLMAYETPVSMALKELGEKNQSVNEKIFTRHHTPSVFQFNPMSRYIETVRRELIFTSASGLPLIRFNLRDSGITFPLSKALTTLEQYSPNWQSRAKNFPLWRLPLVALWGRSDYTIIFYAANIYPEHILAALHQTQFLKLLTGKFTMRKGSLKNMDEYLEINLETRQKIKNTPKLRAQITADIFNKLKSINSEFADASSRFGGKTVPHIKLWTYQHDKYFKPGLKPRFISHD